MSEPNDSKAPEGKIDGKYGDFNEKRLGAPVPGKFCTMFAFDGVDDANILHCTHKYFGAGTATKEQIIRALEKHFSMKPFQRFKVAFTTIEQFGEAGDYRVLRPESNAHFMLDLKAELDKMEPDSFPEYKPHVTVGRNTDSIDMPFRDYVLMEDHKPVWSAVKHFKQLEKESRERMKGNRGKAMSMSERRRQLEDAPSKSGPSEYEPWKTDVNPKVST